MELANRPVRGMLVFLFDTKGRICLAEKKRNIGAGRLNGYGGGLEGNETEREAASREIPEECDYGIFLRPERINLVGCMRFHNRLSETCMCICSIDVFFAPPDSWSGKPRESAEMGRPGWHHVHEIPFERMMLADRDWLTVVLGRPKNTIVLGSIHYAPQMERLDKPSEYSYLKLMKER